MTDQQVQTSFIPKKPLAQERKVHVTSVSVLGFLTTVIVLVAVFSYVGLYLYQKNLETKIAGMTAEFSTKSKIFDDNLVTKMTNLNKRFLSAQEILANHLVVSPLFDFLGKSALKSVQYSTFDFNVARNAGAVSQIDVKISGKAKNYESIANESDELAILNQGDSDPNFKNMISGIVFSGLNLNLIDGGVTFDLNFSVNNNALIYSKYIKS